MSSEQARADALHEAIESRLSAGGGDAVVPQRAGEESGLLVEAARWLQGARPRTNGGLRPSFVLALEEQLRADLALMNSAGLRARRPGARSGMRVAAVVGVAGVLLAGAMAVMGSHPGDVAYPVRRAAEAAFVRASGDGEAGVAAWLDLGRQRLHELQWALASRPEAVRGLAADVQEAYAVAVAEARETGRADVVARADIEAGEASRTLERLGSEATGQGSSAAVWLLAAARALRQDVALGPWRGGDPIRPPPLRPPATPVGPLATGAPSATSMAAVATVGATAVPSEAPQETQSATEAAPIEPPPGETDVPAKPPATGVSDPPPIIPPSTPTVGRAVVGGSPTAGSSGTNTPDRWPETSTPPAAPTKPSPVATAPIEPTPAAPTDPN